MTKYSGLALALSVGLFASCSGPIQKADKLFKEQAAYNEAAEIYKAELAKGKNQGELNAKIAECYRLSNRPAMASNYYKAALDNGEKADSIKYFYAQALKASGQAQEAKAQFASYAAEGRRQKWVDRAKMEERNIDKMPELMTKGSEYEVRNVESINTASSEYGPVFTGEEVAFTATRSGKIYAQNGLPFSDIYTVKTAELEGGAALNPAAYDKFNTGDRHEASATFSKDGKLAIFARSNDGNRKGATDVDLYYSRRDKEGNWSDPEMLPISSTTAWDASPSLSADGKTLYFASNREGGKGGIDLYRSQVDQNGRWGKVTNLGSDINTAGDDMFPYIAEDGKLYFSSDGQPGFGNLDLFVASKADGKTSVENLGQPMNSKADDFGIAYKNGYEGYFTSNRDGGKGDDDIYYFKNVIAEPKVVRYALKGTINERSEGKITGPLAGAKVRLTDADGKPAGEAVTNDQGQFSLPLTEDKNYTVLVEKEGHFTKRDAVSTVGKRPPVKELKKENDIDIPFANNLDKIKLSERIVVDNIYYDYNKSDIRSDAAVELDKIVTMLNDNPAITIELSSHTDSRGDDAYNKKLSQARAESAVGYIVSKGVDNKRITAKGYGEGLPIVKNAATEEEYQKNRRTEFKVTKIAK